MKLWFYGVNEILTVLVKKTEGTDDPKTNTMSKNLTLTKKMNLMKRKQKPEMRRRSGKLVYF
jgi:hypothetical protein